MYIMLRSDKVDANIGDEDGQTTLYTVRAMRARHKLWKYTNCLCTPLYTACKGGKKQVVEVLLGSEKVDTNTGDSFGDTPLTTAKKKGHSTIVKMLEDAGAK